MALGKPDSIIRIVGRIPRERRPPGEPDPLGFVGGEPVEVELEGVPLLRGYVFEARQHVSARGGTVEIGAFSASKDVVDSALTRTRHFADQTIGAIAAELCKPFAVSVEPAKGSEAAFETPLGQGPARQRVRGYGLLRGEPRVPARGDGERGRAARRGDGRGGRGLVSGYRPPSEVLVCSSEELLGPLAGLAKRSAPSGWLPRRERG